MYVHEYLVPVTFDISLGNPLPHLLNTLPNDENTLGPILPKSS